MEKMFEIATRSKMRFPFKGYISVEDLWDLNVAALDSVFKVLNSQVKQANEESLLATKSKEDEMLTTQIEIVKYIVSVKLAEAEVKSQEKAMREQKQKILSILADKQDEALQNMSVEDLQAMLSKME